MDIFVTLKTTLSYLQNEMNSNFKNMEMNKKLLRVDTNDLMNEKWNGVHKVWLCPGKKCEILRVIYNILSFKRNRRQQNYTAHM